MGKQFSYDDYIKVLSLAKQNSDAFEYCLKGNEKYIEELKEKLKPFDDEYFRGLTNEQIADLAKTSIRATKFNRELEDSFEEIKKIILMAQDNSAKMSAIEFKQYFDEQVANDIIEIANRYEVENE